MLLLITLLLPVTLFCQQIEKFSVKGEVIDATRKQVEFANVVILQQDSTLIGGNVADENGRFCLEKLLPGKYILAVTHILYNRKYVNIEISEDIELSPIQLENNTIMLNTVTVTGRSIRNQADRYVVSLKNNPITKGNSAMETIVLLPGISKQDGTLRINGNDVSEIYINERKVKDKSELDAILGENIDKVEVIYSSGSDRDASQTGGIIKILTNKMQERGFYGSTSGSLTMNPSYGFSNDNINNVFNYKRENLSIYNYIYYRNFRDILNYDVKNYYPDSGQSVDMVTENKERSHAFSENLSLVYDLNKQHNIGANIRVHLLNASPDEESNSKVFDKNNLLIESSGSEMTGKLKNNQYQAALNYNWLISENGTKLNLITDYLRYDNSSNENYSYLYNAESTINYLRNNVNQNTDMVELDARFETKIGINQTIELGTSFSSNRTNQLLDYQVKEDGQWIMNEIQSGNFKLSGESYAAYVSFNSKWKNLLYKIGIRAQKEDIGYYASKIDKKNSSDYSGIFPSLNLSYSFNKGEGTLINIGYQRSLNTVPYSAITPIISYNNEYSYTKGNLNLKPPTFDAIMSSLTIKNGWNINYLFLVGRDIIYYSTLVDENNPLLTFTMPVNGEKLIGNVLGIDKTFKIAEWWKCKVNASIERRIYQAGPNESVSNSNSWKYYSSLNNVFRFNNSWGGNLDFYGEPTYKTQERMYKGVCEISGKIYKYLMNDNLLLSLNFIAYKKNRTIVTETGILYSNREFTTSQSEFKITATYKFKQGKNVKTKHSQNIQEYQRIKDD
jgi:hypothetical protein